jgi:hypothetical protein
MVAGNLQTRRLQINPYGQKILIIGDYQTGKTTAAKHILKSVPRRLIWDPTFAFGDRQRRLEDAQRYFDEYGKCTYQPGRGDLAKKFEDFCEFSLQQRNALVFIDEPSMIGDAKKLARLLQDLHRLGHKNGIGVAIASHSVWDIPHVMQQYHHLLCFRVSRIVDLNALRQLVSERGVEWIRHAPDYWFWYANNQSQGIMRPIPTDSKPELHTQIPPGNKGEVPETAETGSGHESEPHGKPGEERF